jgi:tRNA threonylcarbamoyl adenosine modification protein YeaZ
MKILAIEFSSARRSVAALAEGHPLGFAVESASRQTHALALVEQALKLAQLKRSDIQCIAVGLGPGSYTGIRAAIALAQGWQLAASNVKLTGIGSIAAMAREARAKGWFGAVNLVVDAQRGELYLAGYEITPDSCKETRPLKLATIAEARASFSAGELIVGPEVERWFDAGRVLFPGAEMVASLALARTEFITAEKLEPIYLRETGFVKAPPPRVTHA